MAEKLKMVSFLGSSGPVTNRASKCSNKYAEICVLIGLGLNYLIVTYDRAEVQGRKRKPQILHCWGVSFI